LFEVAWEVANKVPDFSDLIVSDLTLAIINSNNFLHHLSSTALFMAEFSLRLTYSLHILDLTPTYVTYDVASPVGFILTGRRHIHSHQNQGSSHCERIWRPVLSHWPAFLQDGADGG
jgi:hypothetical protein